MTLDMIEASRNISGLADNTEADQWSRLIALETNPAWESVQAARARDKQRILKGTLQWKFDRDYKYRLWQQRRAVAEIDQALTATGDLESRTQFVRMNMPLRLADYRVRIMALKPRLDAMQVQINAVLMRQEGRLQTVVAQELEAQKQRLASYRVQARFALATIYDQATVVSTSSSKVMP